MEEIVLVASEEMAEFWRRLARESGVPLEEWIARSCVFVSVVGIPIREAVLRQPPAARELQGVAWELGRVRGLRPPSGHPDVIVPDVTVPVLDVRTELRRRRSWSTR